MLGERLKIFCFGGIEDKKNSSEISWPLVYNYLLIEGKEPSIDKKVNLISKSPDSHQKNGQIFPALEKKILAK